MTSSPTCERPIDVARDCSRSSTAQAFPDSHSDRQPRALAPASPFLVSQITSAGGTPRTRDSGSEAIGSHWHGWRYRPAAPTPSSSCARFGGGAGVAWRGRADRI